MIDLKKYRLSSLIFLSTFYLLAYGFILPHLTSYFAPADDGYYLHTAQRLLAGEILNKEVQSRHAGYIHFINTAWLWIFGNDLFSTRFPLLIMIAVTAWLTFQLFKKESVLPLIAATSVSVIFNAFMAPTPNAHWYCFPLTLGIILLLESAESISSKKLLGIGILVGIIIGFRQLTGGLVGIATLTWLLLDRQKEHSIAKKIVATECITLGIPIIGFLVLLAHIIKFYVAPFDAIQISVWALVAVMWAITRTTPKTQDAVRITSVFLSGMFMGVLPLVAYHLWHGSLGYFFDDTIVRAGTMSGLPYLRDSNFGLYILAGKFFLESAHSFSEVQLAIFWIVLPLVPLFVGLCVVKAMMFGEKIPAISYVSVIYALVAEVYRMHLFLYYIVGLSLLSLIYLERNTRLKIPVCLLSLWLVGIAAIYHVGQGVNRSIWTGEKIQLIDGELPHIGVKMDPIFATRYQKLRMIIEQHSVPGANIFSLPYAPELYVISNRTNPFRFDCGADGIQSDEDSESVKQKLTTLAPLLVIYEPESRYNTPQQQELAEWIIQHSERLGSVDNFQVFNLLKDQSTQQN